MADNSIAGTADDVLSLCRALRDAADMLGLNSSEQADLLEHVTLAEQAATCRPVDQAGMEVQARALRYLLVEVADGPISAFMADDAARIVGDGIGRLFS
jgi:hypothetical protein